ncbi:hypothetical protein SAMIE_1032040 [Sphingobium amiense]|uniref:Uncharacterized protein n=1 Tax=Sphingobium amiense TaxID=135719 RepID=A0A494W536_9SPHN|nr:hypothetical protein [Sphingobium amiense]BBD99703.1 hypothetical protein SAMIE_1032040 [Sphingobium amiense]
MNGKMAQNGAMHHPKWQGAITLLVALGVAQASAQQSAAPPGAGAPTGAAITDPAEIQAIAARLAAAISTEIARMPTTSTVEDYEAAMIFILGQGDYPLDAMLGALDIYEAQGNHSPVIMQAIVNARETIKRRFRRGTAALQQGGGLGNVGFGAFGGAIVGVGGGGGSNYTS